jgi:cilia- and flagella-associated protein 57
MSLEQDSLAQKLKFEDLIFKLEQKYHRDVSKIREDYAQKLKA